VAALVAVRVAVQPRPAPPRDVRLAPEERDRVRSLLGAAGVDRAALVAALAPRRVLLVGETHFHDAPPAWLCGLVADLRAADGRRAVLALELPRHMQRDLDAYRATGDEAALAAAFGRDALPYQRIVRWARAHPEAVAGVVATDEDGWRTGLMRLLLTDTRNETMARAVAAAAFAHPGERVVAYGGSLHMLRAGRYLYDSDTRRPIGARLPALGIPAPDVASVLLRVGAPPADGAWETPGAVRLAGAAGQVPLDEIEEERVFGATRIGEVTDWIVWLGPSERVPRP
jgi:hypothetical protein